MTVTAMITEFCQMKERTTAAEVAAYLMERIREEVGLDDAQYEASLVKPLAWRGATSFARDTMKKGQTLTALLNGEDDEQVDLFPHDFREFVCIGDPEWTFVRRRALQREEYEAGLSLLRRQSDRLGNKIARYQDDYNLAAPFWTPGISFIEAFRLAAERGGA